MPHLKRSVVRRTLLPDSAEGVGEGGCVEGDYSYRVGGGGVSDYGMKEKKVLKVFCQILIVNISASEPSIEKY
jgi:hypothetical protein